MRTKISAVFLLLVITLSFVSSEDLSREYICSKVYLSLQSNIPSSNIVQEILYEKKVGIAVETIESYKNNFESFCSSELNLILNPSYLCQRIYYLILNKNYNFNDDDLLIISNQANVSLNIVNNYIEKNNDLCYSKGLSPKLPDLKYNQIVLNNTKCELNQDSFLGTIPLNIELGKEECNKITFWNNFFQYQETNGFFSLSGIRIYWVIFLVFISLTILIISGIRKSNRLIGKELKRGYT